MFFRISKPRLSLKDSAANRTIDPALIAGRHWLSPAAAREDSLRPIPVIGISINVWSALEICQERMQKTPGRNSVCGASTAMAIAALDRALGCT